MIFSKHPKRAIITHYNHVKWHIFPRAVFPIIFAEPSRHLLLLGGAAANTVGTTTTVTPAPSRGDVNRGGGWREMRFFSM